MKTYLRVLATCVVVLVITITVWAADFSATISVSGGSAQRLSTLLTSNGYTGIMSLDELTICNPQDNSGDMVFGQSNVTMTTGFLLEPGDCHEWDPGTRPTDAQSIYLRVASTQNAAVSLRSR